MIHVMSRGNSIVAGVVLIGILGTLSIALQATTPSTRSVAVLRESQSAEAAAPATVAKTPAVPAKAPNAEQPKAIPCYEGVKYSVKTVNGKLQTSCEFPPNLTCTYNTGNMKATYVSASAQECYDAFLAANDSIAYKGTNAPVCNTVPAAGCDLEHCFPLKGGKTKCVKIVGNFGKDDGFAPANNAAFGFRELVREAAEGDAQAREALQSLKADAATSNGIDQAFKDVIDEYKSVATQDNSKICGMSERCVDSETEKSAKAQEKLNTLTKLNTELSKVGQIEPPADPAKGPRQPGDPAAGPAGPAGPARTQNPDTAKKQPTTGFGQLPTSGSQGPASSGTTNQQCSPRYFCTNNTLYWGSGQPQQNGYTYGSTCTNQIVQYCQYGCAQNNDAACAQNPQSAGQVPVPTLSCGGTNTMLDVGATVPITFACANSVSSSGSGFTTGGVLSGSASATIQKPPAGANVVSYGLTCVASNNQTASARCDVGINLTSIVMVANPKQVTADASTTIGWVTKGMKECVVQAVDVPEGSALETFNTENAGNTSVAGVAVTPGLSEDTTFTLSCKTKTDQLKTATVTVKVQ